MNITRHRGKVLKQVFSLPGSVDRSGSAIVAITPPANDASTSHRSSLSDINGVLLHYEDLVSVLGYFSEIISEYAAEKGLCILIDGRRMPPKALKNVLRASQQAFYHQIRMAIIVQPEKFLHQQKINLDLILEGYEFRTVLVSLHKLSKYIDISQLPENFGGTFAYDAEQWCDEREKIETMMTDLSNLQQDLIQSNGRLQISPEDATIVAGKRLVADLKKSENVHYNVAAKGLKKKIDEIEHLASLPQKEAELSKLNAENEERCRMLEEHAEGVNRLLDWIEGPGEKWLLTLHEIGENKDEARQLVKEHQQLALKSKEIVSQADELADLASRLMAAVPAHSITLEKAREQVRGLARQYANRVERQTGMARQSEEFHTKMSELTRKTDVLLESLCTDLMMNDLAAVESEKSNLEEKVSAMEKMYESVTMCGASFIDDLSAEEVNVHGKRVIRDYMAGIVHVREQLAAARERRKRCLELVDVRRLKLQQFTQLFTCENDAQQAIKWLEELHETLLKDYNQIGSAEDDLRYLREDRLKLEDTARSTYEYGRQLCQVALVLRRSLRMDVKNQIGLNEKLEQTWGRLCRALSENEAKLNVTEAFNTTIVEVNHRIDELGRRVSEVRDSQRNPERVCSIERRRLANDIQELRHIADMLVAQVNANHNVPSETRQAAIASIRRKVDGVDAAHRRMESLFMESNPEPPRSQSLHRLNEPPARPEDLSRSHYHIGSGARRPSHPTNHSNPLSPASEGRSWRAELMQESNIGSIRLSDTESYL
ncbi:hypothetical protein Y032_0592g400 [Ancylostoma ceylanicum]|uniref:CRAL-TRIO domain-containing protein n=1 Tax=Ancylostoma ceylanicum TaxID=53326 RepID=A0A016WPB0_9BILA|nr:hypothetical protein Y032_0592g400 [Ancylostoma ceylanicum]